MTRSALSCLLFTLILIFASPAQSQAFDARLWEKYAEIGISPSGTQEELAALLLEPFLGDVAATPPFADVRVLTDDGKDVPYQIITMKPEQREVGVPARVVNTSLKENGDSWLEIIVDKEDAGVGAVEIATPDADFIRQVQVLGSADGKSWNSIRKDGVIFDVNQRDKLRRTRIDFPETRFRHLALRIAHTDAPALKISRVKVIATSTTSGRTYPIDATIAQTENDPTRRETRLIVRLNSSFPIDRLVIATPERNFQRGVDVQVKGDAGDWATWAEGAIFNFSAPGFHEQRIAVDIPETAARDFRLIIKNHDSPPLQVTGVTGEGYGRLLVFKQQPDRKLYLFWGNPAAQPPRYDLAALGGQRLDELPQAHLGPIRHNQKFAGNNARLPLTERYKYPLYIIIALAIAGLFFLQYRVLRRVE